MSKKKKNNNNLHEKNNEIKEEKVENKDIKNNEKVDNTKQETNISDAIPINENNIEKENKTIEKNKKNEEKEKESSKKEEKQELKEENSKSEAKEQNKKEPNKNEKKEQSNPTENKKKSKKLIIGIVCGLVAFILVIFSIIFSLININNNNILSGISVHGIDISNLSEEEAKQQLNKITTEKLISGIKLVKGEYAVEISSDDIAAVFDVDKAVEEAYNVGRDGNIITNNYTILWTKLFKKDIQLDFSLNEEELNKIIEDTSLKLPTTVVQNSYYIEDDELILTRGTAGDKIKQDELKELIYNKLQDFNTQDNQIEIPTEVVDPDPIDLEKIRQEIYKEAQDAYVTHNPTEVHTHVNGVDFGVTMEEAEKIIEEDKDEYIIPLKITIANKTIADLGEEAFPDELASFTTRYDASNYNRSTNIELATKTINGTVIMPGEVFSYNQTIGRTTLEKGYKEGTAYVGGKVVPDVGGGICQVSSTLYNTALLANLEIVERSNHIFECSYVDPSRDATVYWGSIDFKFKNTRSYPIKIVGTAKNGVVTIDLYGIKEEEEYEVVIESNITSYIPNEVEYKYDSTIEEGKKVVEQVGFNGCRSEGYRILKKNGVVISKTLLSKDSYSPQNKIVRVGTKKTTSATTGTTKQTNNKTN